MSERKQPARSLLAGLKPTVLPEPAQSIMPMEEAAAALMRRQSPAQEAAPPAVQAEAPSMVPVVVPLAVPSAVPSVVEQLAPEAVPPMVPEAVPLSVPLGGPVSRKHREPLVAWSVKLPAGLKTELETVSRFNEIPMSEILVEALRRHLPQYEHPPEGWRQGKTVRR